MRVIQVSNSIYNTGNALVSPDGDFHPVMHEHHDAKARELGIQPRDVNRWARLENWEWRNLNPTDHNDMQLAMVRGWCQFHDEPVPGDE